MAGLGGLVTQVARCCNPVPGEPIAGFVTLGRGITVHSRRCANLRRLAERTPERVLDATWTDAASDNAVTLTLVAEASKGLLTAVTDQVTDAGVGLRAMEHESDPGHGTARIELVLEVADLRELEHVMQRLRALPGTIRVSRGR